MFRRDHDRFGRPPPSSSDPEDIGRWIREQREYYADRIRSDDAAKKVAAPEAVTDPDPEADLEAVATVEAE